MVAVPNNIPLTDSPSWFDSRESDNKIEESKMKKKKIECCGELCWASAAACAIDIGAHRLTVESWVAKTRNGEMDMPLVGNPRKGAHARIPIDRFLAWYGYAGQN